jgi:hypothetical protein
MPNKVSVTVEEELNVFVYCMNWLDYLISEIKTLG